MADDSNPSERRYRALLDLGQIANSSLDLPKVFYRAAGEIRRLFDCDRVDLVLLSAEDGRRHGMSLEFGEPPVWKNLTETDLLNSPAAAAMERRRAEIATANDGGLLEQGMRSYAYLPLNCRDQIIGALGILSRQTGHAGEWDADLLGEAARVLSPPLDNVRAYEQIRDLKRRLEKENAFLRQELHGDSGTLELIGNSPAINSVRSAIEQVAPTDSSVLITGETGTGKELIAQAIHRCSRRSKRLLVSINCAALSHGLINSELFGHEAGAFTGAMRKRLGRFELANKGTLFLDEIAETPPETQVLLLRALQERMIERVGGNEPIAVDARIIAATNRDLSAALADESFRSDLYYRLNVFPIHVPPLRERPEDIRPIVDHFLGRFSSRMGKEIRSIDDATMELLTAYHWPGNVRELEHLIERAIIISSDEVLQIDPSWLTVHSDGGAMPAAKTSMAAMERKAIVEALNECGGKIYGPGGAAGQLQIKPTTLYSRMRKHNIQRKSNSKLFE